jgi:2-polyprenyl-3-methyl-5-hydroxy-6-metoxy-1,4-benzoquinol methylase
MTNSPGSGADNKGKMDYNWKLQKEAEFWGTMARERIKGGIPMTMDFRRATRYRVRRDALDWGDYFQDPPLEAMTPFGKARIRFLKRIGQDSGTNALDLCCGAGWLALELARSGKEVHAVDISLEEIRVAKEYQSTLAEKIPGHINWMITDLNQFCTASGKYDLATAWDGLHHIQNIEHLCEQIKNGLKDGGTFYVCERIRGGENPTIRTRIGKYAEQLLWTMVPTPAPFTYRRKFKELYDTAGLVFRTKILRKKTPHKAWQIKEEGYCSPFEDAVGTEILAAIEKNFEIISIENYGGFTEEILRSLYLPRVLRVPAILFLAWFDQLVVKLGLLEGKISILYARKRKEEYIDQTGRS